METAEIPGEVKPAKENDKSATAKVPSPKWHEIASRQAEEWLEKYTKRYMINYQILDRYKSVELYTVVMKDDNADETVLVLFTFSKDPRIMRVFNSVESLKF